MGWRTRALAAGVVVAQLLMMQAPGSQAAEYVPISGAGSTWASNAIEQAAATVRQYGLTVNYQASGSGNGLRQFANRTVDFGVADEPYEAGDRTPAFGYDYIPIAAGATALMYNLSIGGARVTNLRLTPDLVARIFTGDLTSWDDPAIAARNPGLTLPAIPIVPVVRADSSGTSLQFSGWLKAVAPQRWSRYCVATGRGADCDATGSYPVLSGSGMVAQSGSLGVSGYVAQASSAGAITYVQNAYALNVRFPVAHLLNSSGTYVTPSAGSAGIALLQARTTVSLAAPGFPASVLSGVWSAKDPRAYPLSSYSYLLAPTELSGTFTDAKGLSLTTFAKYLLCEGQGQAEALGYTPLPVNVVKDGLARLSKVPGAVPADLTLSACANPTFAPDGKDTLATTTPQPAPCARIGRVQCGSSTPGVLAAATPVKYPAGSSATRGIGTAIDVCTAPDLAALDAWGASAYRTIAVHIGGANRRCAQPALNAAWVTRATALGWRILPVYDGREAPCTTRSPSAKIGAATATAAAQGQDAASDALRKSAALGLRPGSVVYASIGTYARADTGCRSAVLAFLSGFTTRLHARGYLAGARLDSGSGIQDLASAYRSAGSARPDAIWITNDTAPAAAPLTGVPGLADEAWSNHQRARQQDAQHDESYGGTTLAVTRHRLDGPAATVAQAFTATATAKAYTGPDTSARVTATVRRGAPLTVLCQTPGRKTRGTAVWNKLSDGSYVNDAYVSTAPGTGYAPELPRCAYPAQVLVEDGVTSSAVPGGSLRAQRGLFSGGLAWVTCQSPGTSASGSRVWDQLDTKGYVSDSWLATPGRPSYSTAIPRCL